MCHAADARLMGMGPLESVRGGPAALTPIPIVSLGFEQHNSFTHREMIAKVAFPGIVLVIIAKVAFPGLVVVIIA